MRFTKDFVMGGLRLFELLSDLRPGCEAKAVLLEWNGNQYDRSKTQIVLHEFVNQHGLKGDRGYAIYSETSGRWEAFSGLFEQDSEWRI